MSVSEDLLKRASTKHENALNDVIKIIDDPSWTVKKADAGITFYTRKVPESSFAQLKAVVKLENTTIDLVEETLRPIDTIDEKTDDQKRHGVALQRVLYENDVGDHTSLIYTAMQSPAMLVSGRDFVVYRKFKKMDGLGTFLCVSIDDDEELVPKSSNFVRAVLFFEGYIGKQVGDDVELAYLVHSDPKGDIPAIVYNQVATNQGYSLKGIRRRVYSLRDGKKH